MAVIGVCEDQADIRSILVRGLSASGHEVVAAHNGHEAHALFKQRSDLQVIVMDIALPDADGRDVVQALKSAGQRAPVLFLTAFDSPHDHLAGFAAGADDYVTKPFDLRVLLARVEVLIRRNSVANNPSGNLELDPVTHSIRTEHGEVRLSPTEFRIIAAIASKPGEVVRRQAVIAAAWPDGAIVSPNTVDSFVRRLRSKLDSISATARVETVRGVGYTLTTEAGCDD